MKNAVRRDVAARSRLSRRLLLPIAIVVLLAGPRAFAQRAGSARPNLEGTWNAATLTPLQRPQEFKDKAIFTPEEAAEYLSLIHI